MAVIIRKDGQEVLRIENPIRVRYVLKTEAIEIPMPDWSDPLIFQIGGVSRRLSIEWREISSDLPRSISKLAEELMSGEMFPVYEITIEEWGITKNCVLFDLDISQEGGEANTFVCRLTVAMGRLE